MESIKKNVSESAKELLQYNIRGIADLKVRLKKFHNISKESMYVLDKYLDFVERRAFNDGVDKGQKELQSKLKQVLGIEENHFE